jgi:hypothetical protein
MAVLQLFINIFKARAARACIKVNNYVPSSLQSFKKACNDVTRFVNK